MTAPPSAALDFVDLHYTYPDGRPALDGLSLRVQPGERVAVLGPNGSGKSTFCLHTNGILTPQRGSVTVHGNPVTGKYLQEVRHLVGVVFQDPDDMLFMPTVAADVGFGPANLGLSADVVQGRVESALRMVGMSGLQDRPPHHLSFGQRKRVAAAAVLSMQPRVLVLDEPSSNLDPRARREFGDILRRYDGTMIMVTHDLPFAAMLCDRAVIIDAGHIAADGDAAEILANDSLLAAHDLEFPEGIRVRGNG